MLPRVVPVHGHDPRRMTCQVHDLFPGTHVVERNDGGVTRRGQKLAGGRKGHGAGGFDETEQRMQQPPRVVVEDVDPAVLVAGSRESSISGQIDAHAKTPLGVVLSDLLASTRRVPDVDTAIVRRAR